MPRYGVPYFLTQISLSKVLGLGYAKECKRKGRLARVMHREMQQMVSHPYPALILFLGSMSL